MNKQERLFGILDACVVVGFCGFLGALIAGNAKAAMVSAVFFMVGGFGLEWKRRKKWAS